MSLSPLVQVADHETMGSDLPTVSWLLCTHVADSQLRLAVQSCLDQTVADFELLLIINGSAAVELAKVVRSWFGAEPRLRIYTTEVRHLIFSLSLGLHHARADLVARMDSDDLSVPDRLSHQIAFMRQHPEVAVLGGAYQVIDENGQVQKIVTLPESDMAVRRALLWGNPLCHPSVMFRRKVVLDAGGYLGGLHAEDYDLWLRLSVDPAVKFANLDAVCLGYRSVGVGTARRARSGYASMASAQYRHFVNGFGIRWLLAALVSTLKAYVRSDKVRHSSVI